HRLTLFSRSCLSQIWRYTDLSCTTIPFGLLDSLVDNNGASTYTLLDLLWSVLAICLVGTIVFTFFFSLIVSHRMAGPVYPG
ncbi:MAG TPA: hypothetical protein QF423_00925, partial [Candidatus Scalindua sp.]|nr:hypothetical protein [Candidatus Scalindua sp.]